jgi:hypothetical protein
MSWYDFLLLVHIFVMAAVFALGIGWASSRARADAVPERAGG